MLRDTANRCQVCCAASAAGAAGESRAGVRDGKQVSGCAGPSTLAVSQRELQFALVSEAADEVKPDFAIQTQSRLVAQLRRYEEFRKAGLCRKVNRQPGYLGAQACAAIFLMNKNCKLHRGVGDGTEYGVSHHASSIPSQQSPGLLLETIKPMSDTPQVGRWETLRDPLGGEALIHFDEPAKVLKSVLSNPQSLPRAGSDLHGPKWSFL